MPPEAARRLIVALKKNGRRRFPLDLLRQAFASACPEFAEQPDRRIRLAETLHIAAATGEILLPKQARNWDGAGSAALPGFVMLAAARPVRAPVVTAGYAWHPILSFAAGERNRLRLESAKRINEWLKNDPDLSLVVPIKERSLEIFGDEKRLDHLRDGTISLFGQLSLTALGCRVCPIPLPFEAGPVAARGQPILIIENNDTWASFSRWNRNAARFSAVAYAGGGHGKSLAHDEYFIDELLDRFQAAQLLYFGDVDPAGLRIARGAAERRMARGALPLQPATLLYAWLLAHGMRTTLRRTEKATPRDIIWLPEGMRGAVESLFADGHRIPQESLGTRALAAGQLNF